jgi:hypothetical protein
VECLANTSNDTVIEMPRSKTDLGPAISARIIELRSSGGTAASIADELARLGVQGVSRATIGRRLRELDADIKAARAAAGEAASARAAGNPDAPLPETTDEIPDGATLSQINAWIVQVETAATAAEAAADHKQLCSLLRVAGALGELRRRSTPLPKPNLNEYPDMIEAAKRCRERLHKLIESAVESAAAKAKAEVQS